MITDYIKESEKKIQELYNTCKELDAEQHKLYAEIKERELNIANSLTDQNLMGKKVKVVTEMGDEPVVKDFIGYYYGFDVMFYGTRLKLIKPLKNGKEGKLEYNELELVYTNIKSITAIL